MRIVVLEHNDYIPAGHLATALDAAGADVTTLRIGCGDPVAGIDGWDGIVILGGEMGAYDTDRFPWLDDEKRMVADAVAADVPLFGVCLGSQLMADGLGGEAYLAPAKEIGVIDVELTDAGRADPVVKHLDAPCVVWHQDTFDLPPGAVLLARSDRYPHAFRIGSALAVQGHPEASPEIVESWIAQSGRAALRACGVDPDDLRAQVAATAEVQQQMALRLFGAWLSEIAPPSVRQPTVAGSARPLPR